MQWRYTAYVWPFVVALLIAAVLGYYAWRRRGVRSAPAFLVLVALAAIWSLLSSVQLLAVGLEAKAVLSRARYFIIATLPVAWLLFALSYTGRRHWLSPRRILALLSLPGMTILLAVTNPWHGLLFESMTLYTAGPVESVAAIYGPWFWVHTAYSYALMGLGALLIAAYRLHASALYRRQASVMLAGALAPLGLNVLFLHNPAWFANVDVTPIGFALSGVFFAWGLFRYHLLDLMPVARAAIVKSLPDGVVVLDAQHRVVELNPAAQDLFGVTSAEAMGRPPDALTQDLDLPWLDDTITEGLTEEITLTVHGERRHFLCDLSPLQREHPHTDEHLAVIVLRDVTAQKRSQQLEAGQKRILEMIAEGRPLPIVLDGVARFAESLSQAGMLCSILLLDEDGVHLRHGAAPSLPDAYTEAIDGTAIGPYAGSCGAAAYHGRRIVATDLTTDERWAPYDHLATAHGLRACWSTPIRSSEDDVLGTFAVYYRTPGAPDPGDERIIEMATSLAGIAIERRRFEDALIQAKERAEEMARLKSSFLANMSHEIRTPLTSIIGFADVLAEAVDAEHQDLVAHIAKGGQRLFETLNSVLDYARLEAGTIEVHTQVLDLVTIAEETVAFFRPQAEAKNLKMILTLHSTEARAELDHALLTRILNNLVDNALKFTDEGSITLEVDAGADAVYLRVQDTGRGISDAFMPSLFDAFKQESSGLSRSHEGSGLGLKITRHLVEQMQGSIDVTSEKGTGSTFTVTFPRVATPDDVALKQTGRREGRDEGVRASPSRSGTFPDAAST